MLRVSAYPVGTILKVYCPSKFVHHYGVLSYNNMVIDLAPRKGIAQRSFYEFSEGQPVKVVPHTINDAPLEITHERALSQVGKQGYSAWKMNCEHFVTWCKSGEWKSSQIETAKTVGGVAITGLILYKIFSQDD